MRARHRHFNARDAGAVFVVDSRYIDQSDGTAVSAWADRSRSGFDLVQTTAARQPTFQTAEIGGNSTVQFDGNDSLFRSTVPILKNVSGMTGLLVSKKVTLSGTQTTLWVATPTNGNARFVFHHNISANKYSVYARRLDTGPAPNLVSTSNIPNTALIHCAVINLSNTSANQYGNGSLEGTSSAFLTTGATSNTDSHTLAVGAVRSDGFLGFNGHIALATIFDNATDNSLRKRLEHAAAYSFKISCN